MKPTQRTVAEGTIGLGDSSATAVPTVQSLVARSPGTPLVGRDGQLVPVSRRR